MDLQLTGKLALVTGSTAGIGFAIAKSLAAEGCRVIITGRGEERVDAGMEKIQEAYPQAELEGLDCDLATPQGAEDIIRRFPEVDILVNNLGRYEERPFEATSDADWQAIIEINFMSGVRLSRHYLPPPEGPGVGADHFSVERVRGPYPAGDDSLRRYQSHVPGPEPGVGRDYRGDGRDGECGAARPHPLGRGQTLSGGNGPGERNFP